MKDKKDEYFSHDYHAQEDPKMIRLRMSMQMEGVGIYWCLIEKMYINGGYFNTSDIDTYAYSMQIPIEKLNSVINDFQLFVVNEHHFYSNSVLERLEQRNEKYSKQSEAGKKAALSRWNNAERIPTACESYTTAMRIDAKEKEKEKDKVNTKEIKEKEYIDFPSNQIPPTREAVNYYCLNVNKKIDIDDYFEHYKSNGWKVGKNSMKDWHGAVHTFWKDKKLRYDPIDREKRLAIANGENIDIKTPIVSEIDTKHELDEELVPLPPEILNFKLPEVSYDELFKKRN